MFVLINAITSWCEAAFPFGVDQMYQISSWQFDAAFLHPRWKQFIPLRLSVVMFWLCFQMVWQVTNFANFLTSDYTNTAFAWPLVLRPPKYPTVTHNVPFKWTATCFNTDVRQKSKGFCHCLVKKLFTIVYLQDIDLNTNFQK